MIACIMRKDMEAFDFSKDSCIREALLNRIKAECFGDLGEDQLELVSAAGNPQQYLPDDLLTDDKRTR